MDWTRPEVISAAALATSVLSLAVSGLVAWRGFAADRPRAWLIIEPTQVPDCWIGNIHLRSGPHIGLVGHSVRLDITTLASARNQPLLLGDFFEIAARDDHGNVKLSDDYRSKCNAFKIALHHQLSSTVPQGQQGIIPVVIYRPALSRSEKIKLTVSVQKLSSSPSYRDLVIRSDLPGGGIQIVLG